MQNQGDCWNAIIEGLDRALEALLLTHPESENASEDKGLPNVFPIDVAGKLGQRTAEMHRAFAIDTPDPAFAREPVTAADITAWLEAVRTEAAHAFQALDQAEANADETTLDAINRLRDARAQIDARLSDLEKTPAAGAKTRVHGDYHLGQVLVSKDDVVIIDFEGEPSRPLAERRQKTSPLRDLAGMLRSIDYAAFAALDRLAGHMPELSERAVAAVEGWRKRSSDEFLQIYKATAAGMASYPDDEEAAMKQLEIFLLQKAFYEISYEAANRPAWLSIPVRGVLDLISRHNPDSHTFVRRTKTG